MAWWVWLLISLGGLYALYFILNFLVFLVAFILILAGIRSGDERDWVFRQTHSKRRTHR